MQGEPAGEGLKRHLKEQARGEELWRPAIAGREGIAERAQRTHRRGIRRLRRRVWWLAKESAVQQPDDDDKEPREHEGKLYTVRAQLTRAAEDEHRAKAH